MAIEKELWLTIIKEKFIPDTSFLAMCKNLDEFVDNNILHLQEAGVDPKVLIDNQVYPIPMATREDISLELPLHTFDTENTIVRNIEEKESSYNKMESVVRGHKNSLVKQLAAHAAHNWCPDKDGEFTPVVTSKVIGKVSFADFYTIQARFMALDVDLGTVVVVLNAAHLMDLRVENDKLYKDVMASNQICGMKMFTYSGLPYFNTTTGVKKAFGAAITADHTQASLVYCTEEVCLAKGTVEVFAKYKDPEQRGDIVGFQQRAMALPIRKKYIGAIYSSVAVVEPAPESGA